MEAEMTNDQKLAAIGRHYGNAVEARLGEDKLDLVAHLNGIGMLVHQLLDYHLAQLTEDELELLRDRREEAA